MKSRATRADSPVESAVAIVPPVRSSGQAIIETLARNGVRHVFGVPGVHTYELFDALHSYRDRVTYLGARHEQGAGYMAYGYAASTGDLGVYTCVPGPGILNSGAALATAYAANAPVLCLTSEIPSTEIGRGHGILHELPDQMTLLRGLTKWAERIDHPSEAPRVVGEAVRCARSGRPRPVALACPWDVLGIRAPVNFEEPVAREMPPVPDPDMVSRAADLMVAAKRPLVMLGSGAVEAGEEILALARRLQAPVTSHRNGRGIVGEDLPYGLPSAAAYEYWQTTDLLIAIGTRMELQYIRWRRLPPGLKIVRIDIDPTEMARRTVDVAIVADARDGVLALLAELASRRLDPPVREQEFAELKASARARFAAVQPQVAYLDAIREVLPKDGFFVEEICQAGFAARFAFPVFRPRTYVSSGFQDNLGFGFMTALGVKVANPSRTVVSVSGDGGFMFGVQELATAVQHGIGVVAIVFNNRGFGNVLRDQGTRFDGRVIGADLVNPDFVALARSFGVDAVGVNDPLRFRRELEAALSSGVPRLIEVQLEPGSEASPWPFLHPNGFG
jgi:acetolactate synthase-1/2/3 large subunit